MIFRQKRGKRLGFVKKSSLIIIYISIAIVSDNTKNNVTKAASVSNRSASRRRAKRFRILLWFWRNRKKEAAFIAALIAIGVLITQCAYDIIAYNALTSSKETSHRQLRAYVGIADGGDVVKPDNQPVQIDLKIQNFGQTSASNVSIRATWYKLKMGAGGEILELPKDFTYPIQPTVEPTRTTNVLPDNGVIYLDPNQPMSYYKPVNDKDIDILNDRYNKEYLTFFYGEIRYTDIYNATHIRQFCTAIILDLPDKKFFLHFTDTHNDEIDVK